MFNVSTQDFSPNSLDSPKETQDFKQVNLPNFPAVKKCPIIAVSLRPLPNLEFEVTIARRYKPIKVYSTRLELTEKLVNVVNNLRHKSQAWVCPQVVGWTAYIEAGPFALPYKDPRAVYPPPVDKACFGCETGRLKPGAYGWYCFECETYEPDEGTSEIATDMLRAQSAGWVELEKGCLAELNIRERITAFSAREGVKS